MQQTQLYLISPPNIQNLDAFLKVLEDIAHTGAVSSFQLRLKDIENRDIAKMGKPIFELLQSAGIACIMNDHARLARDTHADGVHLGQSDDSIKEAREILSKDKIIGVTCHNSKHLAMSAAEAGADYVAFGAFYETQTKITEQRADLETLEWWQDLMEIPCVAIGGINACNALPIIKAGADFIAVSSCVWNNPKGAKAAVLELNDVLENIHTEQDKS